MEEPVHSGADRYGAELGCVTGLALCFGDASHNAQLFGVGNIVGFEASVKDVKDVDPCLGGRRHLGACLWVGCCKEIGVDLVVVIVGIGGD